MKILPTIGKITYCMCLFTVKGDLYLNNWNYISYKQNHTHYNMQWNAYSIVGDLNREKLPLKIINEARVKKYL